MIRGLTGSLLSHDALRDLVERDRGRRDGREEALQALRRWHQPVRASFGPTAGARTVFDRIATPLFGQLGYQVLPEPGDGPHVRGLLAADGRPVAGLIVTAWDVNLAGAWRDSVRQGIANDVRWCFCTNGAALRIVDARRSYSRRYAEFALEAALDDPAAAAVLHTLLGGLSPGTGAGESTLDRAVVLSEQVRAEVRASLQAGVREALEHLLAAFGRAPGRRRRDAAATFDESLIVIYRVLFLLFAEARGLVPRWHPTYRESYTIESLRDAIEREAHPHGLWEALQAIARMAHRGCRAGNLRVPPFNGRLFSPAGAPLADALALDDGAVRQAMLALTTRSRRTGRQRISYVDLGVEHLGGVYERVLDFQPATQAGGTPTLVRGERRKSTGSFYTPRSLTEYLVRRTLAPLADRAPADEILSLRVLDPAMGSGAFVVAACRYLAAAYEQALIREGSIGPQSVDESDRAGFRRIIAQRCLFGVDLNPMAVQLARLSLWLATLSDDRPLTFLDHQLRAGNSLVGASVIDLLRQPPGHGPGAATLPLFTGEGLEEALASTVTPRIGIAQMPGDTLDQVRAKEQVLASLERPEAPLAGWKAAADLWCACWFSATRSLRSRATFGALLDTILRGSGGLPRTLSAPLLAEVRNTARVVGCFHWTFEFPEAFYGQDGAALENPGFDAVLGNPPWEVLRGDRGDEQERTRAHAAGAALTAFARRAGIYRLQLAGHANLYQLFLERALSLVRRGGRFGLVLPSGFSNDSGSAALRRHLLDRATVDTLVGIENRDGVFPIHRGLRFLLLSGTSGGTTDTLPCRFGVRSPEVLDAMPDRGDDAACVKVPRALLDRNLAGGGAIPELRTTADLALFSTLVCRAPALGSSEGWNVRFSRELNATDDRAHFVRTGGGLPVVEGKHVRPFDVDLTAVRYFIDAAVAERLLHGGTPFRRPRLAYRDVAASTNRLTLIAAIVPAGAVTTHTLFCLRGEAREDEHLFLCGLLNSYVANYLVRLRVGTHVTAAIAGWLPAPKPSRDSPDFVGIVSLVRRILENPDGVAEVAELQAACARLYDLTAEQFQRVLDSLPLIPEAERERAMVCFRG